MLNNPSLIRPTSNFYGRNDFDGLVFYNKLMTTKANPTPVAAERHAISP
jgi:hypothetical protein